LRSDLWLRIVAVVCIAALGIVYFITVRKDGTVLATLCSVIGYLVGRWKNNRREVMSGG